MKNLIIIALATFSLNGFAAQVGEDKKGECLYSNQSNKREGKVIESSSAPAAEIKKETKGAIAK